MALLSFAQPARFFGAVQARFMSVDPMAIIEERIMNPQQLNRYGSCRGNPLLYIDPTGETIHMVADSTDDPDGKEAAEAWQKEIQGQETFDSKKDVVVVFGKAPYVHVGCPLEEALRKGCGEEPLRPYTWPARMG